MPIQSIYVAIRRPGPLHLHHATSEKVNPFIPSGLFCLNSLDWSICNRRDVWLVFIITII